MIRLFIFGTPENVMLILILINIASMMLILGAIKLFEKLEWFGLKKESKEPFNICLNGKNYTIDPNPNYWVVDQMADQDAARNKNKEV